MTNSTLNKANPDTKFKRNDIVSTSEHNRLMVVEGYHEVVDKGISPKGMGNFIVVTEGGHWKENELTLVYRK